MDVEIGVQNNKIEYSFYSKPVSSKYTILKRTALSDIIKKHTIFQECLRRQSNASLSLPSSEYIRHLNDYSNCMRVSGYSHIERYHSNNGAIERVNMMRKEVTTGKRSSLFQDRESIMAAKKSKQDWSNTWYLKNGIKSTVPCPVTAGGVLKT